MWGLKVIYGVAVKLDACNITVQYAICACARSFCFDPARLYMHVACFQGSQTFKVQGLNIPLFERQEGRKGEGS